MSARRLDELPRSACAAAAVALLFHAWAAVTGLQRSYWIPAWHWALLAASMGLLIAAMVARPDHFRLREFRLGGVAVITLSTLILAPLPGQVRRFDSSAPHPMVLAIAGGVAAMAIVFFLAPRRSPQPIATSRHSRNDLYVPLMILGGAVLVFPLWVRSLGSLPIVQLLTGRAAGLDIAVARFEALRGLGSVPLRIVVGAIRNVYLMFAVSWLVVRWTASDRADWRERTRWRLAAALCLGIAVGFALITTERAIVGQVGVVAAIAAILATRRRITLRLLAAMSAVGLAFPLLFGFVSLTTEGGSPLSGSIESVRRRLFYVPSDVMMQYFASFPGRRDFLHGASIPKVSRLFGAETFDLSGYVYEVAYQFDERFTGNANASFLGVGWANFGVVGVITWCAVAAIAIVWLERLLRRLPRRTSIALRAVACLQVALLTAADLTRTILSFGPGFLDLVLAVWLVTLFEERRTAHVGVTGLAPLRVDGG